MKKSLMLFAFPILMYAQNLEQILNSATQNNMILKSKEFTIKSKSQEIKAIDAQYYPQVNLGANYETLNERTKGSAGDQYELYGKVSVDIYDGGEKYNKKEALKALYLGSKYDKEAYLKSLHLNIIEDFFNIRNNQAQLDALIEKSIQLKAELERIKKFYEVGSATKDDIDKFKAEYSNNIYRIDTLKHQQLSLKRLFILKVGVDINKFEESLIERPIALEKEESSYIKVLRQNSASLSSQAKSLDSNYLPKVTLEDKYSFYEYDRDGKGYEEGLNDQNSLTLSVSMKLFDNGVYKRQKESLLLQKRAVEEQIKQADLSQNINIELSNSNIRTIEAQLESAKDSLVAANSAFETIRKKFEIGSVDNIAFLDALSVKTSSKAQYETAKNNLQIAYARYYYYLNKNIKDFIK